MEDILETCYHFFSGQDPNVKYVVSGTMILSLTAAIVGCFTLLRKQALIGEAMAHAVLPGIALAFLMFQSKNPLVLLVGAIITGWLSTFCIDFITSRSRIKPDSAIALVLSVFFGLGVVLLTVIQNSGMANQAGLDKFLFGKAASLLGQDLVLFTSISLMVISVLVLFYKQFFLVTFDPEYAKVLGIPVERYELLLSILTVLTVATGIQAVGVVLMAALLITPGAAARHWTDKLGTMLILAGIFGAFSGLGGAFISYSAQAMPTGPWIVVFVSSIAITSFLTAPNKGIIARAVKKRRQKNKMMEENILKALFQLGEQADEYFKLHTAADLAEFRSFSDQPEKGLKRLKKKGLVAQQSNKWQLTQKGYEYGARIVRLHRLWELYLNEYVRIAHDHVHQDAEAMEHIITPEIEKKLQELLDYPQSDPHQTKIPQQKTDT